MIDFLHLPPLLGERDIEAEAELARKRTEALAWMARNNVRYLGREVEKSIAPIPDSRVHYLRQRSTEGTAS